MTYAWITEWMDKEEVEKFDRELLEDPRVSATRKAQEDARALMSVFGMAGAMGVAGA